MGFTLLLLHSEDRPETHPARDWPPLLRERIPGIEICCTDSVEEATAFMPRAEAAFGEFGPEIFEQRQVLRWLASPRAGPHPSFYHKPLVESDVIVTNTRGIYNDHISAHVMACLLSFARGLPTYWEQQSRRVWQTGVPIVYLPEATCLIVGVGGIGAETARLCAALGMTVLGVDPRVTEAPPGLAELHGPQALDDLLPRAEFVVLTAPETPATQGYFHAQRFARMKPGAFFCNIGRGATVVLDDLNEALRSGHLGGAALDVFQIEPLPQAHPLWDAPGMMITPHVAVDGPYSDERRTSLFIENCVRFNAGQPLLNIVDKANWY